MRQFRILLALCLLNGAVLAQTPTDNTSGGTFVTPGYMPPTSQTAPTRPGTQGQNTPDSSSGTTPPLRSPNGSRDSTNPQPTGNQTRTTPADTERQPQRQRPETPSRPSEFQRFVEGATGRLLPVFGANFFT
jgi:polysaccharide biosynthesis/export protein